VLHGPGRRGHRCRRRPLITVGRGRCRRRRTPRLRLRRPVVERFDEARCDHRGARALTTPAATYSSGTARRARERRRRSGARRSSLTQKCRGARRLRRLKPPRTVSGGGIPVISPTRPAARPATAVLDLSSVGGSGVGGLITRPRHRTGSPAPKPGLLIMRLRPAAPPPAGLPSSVLRQPRTSSESPIRGLRRRSPTN